jgi:long-chain fatty acid transport protein
MHITHTSGSPAEAGHQKWGEEKSMILNKRWLVRPLAAAAVMALSTSAAFASEGYLGYGYGARQKGMAGAGVADSRDATAASLNPAGLTHLKGMEIDFSATLFSPNRDMTGSADAGFTPSGGVDSKKDYFLVPNMAMSYRLRGNPLADVVAVTMYGNGGMNTSYPQIGNSVMPGCTPGVFGCGAAGVDLQQVFVSFAAAKQAGNFSFGVAPILARQQFEAKGLAAFSGASSDASNLTNRGMDVSFGGGVRAGMEWAVTPGLRVGVAGNSRVWMQEFERYRGLFAEHGSFDIPANLQAGIAYDIKPNLTVMADYKHIWYGSVAAIANPSTNILAGDKLGADNGPGFGWKDVDVIKLGVEWRDAMPGTTFRAGYAHSTNPVTSRDAMFNILAPGIVQDHFTAGAELKLSRCTSLEVAGAYVPRNEVKGHELAMQGANPAHTIDIGMSQYEITMGLKYKMGDNPAPLK